MLQGIESNVKHHRRLSPLLWPETRPNDAFAHYPHGGRLDTRWRRGSNYNDSVTTGLPAGESWSTHTFAGGAGTLVSANLVNTPKANDPATPPVHFSHLLNYDYFKTALPAVRTFCGPLGCAWDARSRSPLATRGGCCAWSRCEHCCCAGHGCHR